VILKGLNDAFHCSIFSGFRKRRARKAPMAFCPFIPWEIFKDFLNGMKLITTGNKVTLLNFE